MTVMTSEADFALLRRHIPLSNTVRDDYDRKSYTKYSKDGVYEAVINEYLFRDVLAILIICASKEPKINEPDLFRIESLNEMVEHRKRSKR